VPRTEVHTAAALATAPAGIGGATGGGGAAVRFKRKPAGADAGAAEEASAATGMGAAIACSGIWASRLLASCVPSTAQTGQLTGKGIRPWTGSTSNLYFWPQLQTTLSSIRLSFAREHPPSGRPSFS
jgi:hypothetical protein